MLWRSNRPFLHILGTSTGTVFPLSTFSSWLVRNMVIVIPMLQLWIRKRHIHCAMNPCNVNELMLELRNANCDYLANRILLHCFKRCLSTAPPTCLQWMRSICTAPSFNPYQLKSDCRTPRDQRITQPVAMWLHPINFQAFGSELSPQLATFFVCRGI